MAGCFQCVLCVSVITVLIFPAALAGEWLLVSRLKWRWWVHIPAMAVLYFLIGYLAWVVLFLGKDDRLDTWSLAVALCDVALPGVAYWLALRAVGWWLDTSTLFRPNLTDAQGSAQLAGSYDEAAAAPGEEG